MTRDWNSVGASLHYLEKRIAAIAPGNTAEFPLCITKEKDEHGIWGWVVDVSIRIPGVTEYEVAGVARTITGALRRALLGLNNQPLLRQRADAANKQFGVIV